MRKPDPAYIAVDAKNAPLDEATLLEIEEMIRKKDGVQSPVLSCANDSEQLADFVRPMDFTNMGFWPFLVIMVVSKDGRVNAYRPGGLMTRFIERAKPGVGSYELFTDLGILKLEENGSAH